MGHRFAEIVFTEEVKDVQAEKGSRTGYARMEQGEDFNFLLSEKESSFIQDRDSFYMSSVTETDWPYVQHRGGPRGFVKVLDERIIGFADYSGNRQYVSTGNFRKNNRVAIIFMDYVNRRRLKLLGRVTEVTNDNLELIASLETPGYRAEVERGFLIHVEGFDWNCPQFITPRYTEEDVQSQMAPIVEENRKLKSTSNGQQLRRVLGEGQLELVVSGIKQLTPNIRSWELRAPDGAPLPEVSAGAHLKIPVQLQSADISYRYYSISSNPRQRDYYEIAVNRDEKGSGGSLSLHNTFHLGQHLRCELPENRFPLEPGSERYMLIAGGIGITPIKAMAHSLLASGADFELHYAGRSRQDMAFVGELGRDLEASLVLYSSDANQRLNVRELLSGIDDQTAVYVCGPADLLSDVIDSASALGINPDRIRYERFVPHVEDSARPITVHLKKSARTIEVSENQTILDALLIAGEDVPYSCKTGVCRTCAVEVLEGEADHRDAALSEAEKVKGKLFCPCVSRAQGDALTLDL